MLDALNFPRFLECSCIFPCGFPLVTTSHLWGGFGSGFRIVRSRAHLRNALHVAGFFEFVVFPPGQRLDFQYLCCYPFTLAFYSCVVCFWVQPKLFRNKLLWMILRSKELQSTGGRKSYFIQETDNWLVGGRLPLKIQFSNRFMKKPWWMQPTCIRGFGSHLPSWLSENSVEGV